MSTKIWTAWRVPLTRFNEASDLLHQVMFDLSYATYKTVIDQSVAHTATILGDGDRKFRSAFLADRQLREIMDKTQPANAVGIECGFHFYIDDLTPFVYIIPWGAHNDDIVVLDWFEEYHYQNSTDRPDDISNEDWKTRYETWDRILLSAPDSRKHRHDVVMASNHELFCSLWLQYMKDLKTARDADSSSQ